MKYMKLSDIRAALELSLERPISRQAADYYSHINSFPPPVIEHPIRLWDAAAVKRWVKKR